MIWLTSMTLSDLDRLEEVFATLTPQGWIVPDWLIQAREYLK